MQTGMSFGRAIRERFGEPGSDSVPRVGWVCRLVLSCLALDDFDRICVRSKPHVGTPMFCLSAYGLGPTIRCFARATFVTFPRQCPSLSS